MTRESHRKLDGARITLFEREEARRLVVFFAGRGDCGAELATDYGAGFAERAGINAAFVQPLKPLWYQWPLALSLPRELRQLGRDYEDVTYVGAGMGGYGALLSATACTADHVIAFRPVATLDNAKAPARTGRQRDRARIGRDLEPVVTHRARHYTIFAGGGDDMAHAARFYLPGARTTWRATAELLRGRGLPLADADMLALLTPTGQDRERRATG